MRCNLFILCACLIILLSSSAQAQVPSSPQQSLPILDRSIFDKPYMIYGSEIGGWNMDGGNAISNPVCRQKVMDAKVRVIRWANWAKFDYMKQKGSEPKQTLAQFNMVVDGIRSMGAYPLIKLPPVWNKQCDSAIDSWNLDWLKEIIKAAGNRVQLYEFANEPNNYCHWDAATYADNWKKTVPALKEYARSLGFEIYVGGPAWTNSNQSDIARLKVFLDSIKQDFVLHVNRDELPDFVSTHTYMTEHENSSPENMQKAIHNWGKFYDDLRETIDQEFQGINDASGNPLGPQIKIADTEYNFTIVHDNPKQNDPPFIHAYMKGMMNMFREHNIWLANQFTIQSHHGEALDMLTDDCTDKLLYSSFKFHSTRDPLNQ